MQSHWYILSVDLHRGSLLLGFGYLLPLWTEYGCSKEDDFTLELVNSQHVHWPVPDIFSAEYGGTQHVYNWLVLLLLWTLLTFHFVRRLPLSEGEVQISRQHTLGCYESLDEVTVIHYMYF
jgi:hypothetical protein